MSVHNIITGNTQVDEKRYDEYSWIIFLFDVANKYHSNRTSTGEKRYMQQQTEYRITSYELMTRQRLMEEIKGGPEWYALDEISLAASLIVCDRMQEGYDFEPEEEYEKIKKELFDQFKRDNP